MEELEYVKWSNNKLRIDPNKYKIIDEDKPYKKISKNIKLDNMIDDNLEDVKAKVIKKINHNIYDPFNLPDTIEVKRKKINIDEKLLDEFIQGFHDTSSVKELSKRPSSYYIFNQPTNKDIKISNLQTENGTSNDLNNRIIENQTQESLIDIKDANETLDDIYKNETNSILNQIKLSKESIKNQIANNKNKKGSIDNVNNTKSLDEELRNLNHQEKEVLPTVLENINKRKIKHKANIRPIISNIKESKLVSKNKDFTKYDIANDIDEVVENTVNKIKNKNTGKIAVNKVIDDILNNVDKKVNKKEKDAINESQNKAASKIQNKYKKHQNKSTEFKQENPMNETKADEKADTKADDKEKQKQVYENKQTGIKLYNDMIKTENENYDKFNRLYEELNKLSDGEKLETNNNVRKDINKLLKTYDKKNLNVGAARSKSALMKKLDDIKEEINKIHQRRINDSESKKKALKEDKKISYSTPKAKTRTLNDLDSPTVAEGKGKVKSRAQYI